MEPLRLWQAGDGSARALRELLEYPGGHLRQQSEASSKSYLLPRLCPWRSTSEVIRGARLFQSEGAEAQRLDYV